MNVGFKSILPFQAVSICLFAVGLEFQFPGERVEVFLHYGAGSNQCLCQVLPAWGCYPHWAMLVVLAGLANAMGWAEGGAAIKPLKRLTWLSPSVPPR